MTDFVRPKKVHSRGTALFPAEATIFCRYKKVPHPKWDGHFSLIADEILLPGTVIQRAGGLVVTELDDVPPHLRYAVLADEGIFITPADYTNLEDFWFMNHSCDANIARIGGSVMVARKRIEVGEELTIDYSPLIATTNGSDMECLCGAATCRGRISGDDWKKPELARALWQEWLPHIQRRIVSEVAEFSL